MIVSRVVPKTPIVTPVQSQNSLPLHPIMCAMPLGSDPLLVQKMFGREGKRDLLLERTFLGVLSLGSCLLVARLLLWRWAFDGMMARGMSLGVVWQGIILASPLPLSLCAALCMRR